MQNLIKSTVLILALGLSATAFAQAPQDAQPAPPPHHQPNPNHQAKELAKRLGLTPDQVAQVEPILADRDQKQQALMANTSLDPKSMHQQRRAIMQDADQKLNAVLTPAQQQQYATLKQQRRQHQSEPGAPATPAPSV